MDTVRIERFSSRVEADLACSMLTAQGFNARVSGDDVAGVHPDIPFGIGGTAVVVPREQYDDAIALLDEEFAGPLGDAADHQDVAGSGDGPQHTTPAGSPEAHGADDADGAHDTHDADDTEWAGEGQRRPGVRVFAVVAATAILVVFLAATGSAVGWW